MEVVVLSVGEYHAESVAEENAVSVAEAVALYVAEAVAVSVVETHVESIATTDAAFDGEVPTPTAGGRGNSTQSPKSPVELGDRRQRFWLPSLVHGVTVPAASSAGREIPTYTITPTTRTTTSLSSI